MCSCACVCVLEVAVFSLSCMFISKQILSAHGEVILKMPAAQRECLFCCSSALCSLFPIAEIRPLACRFLPGALAACQGYGGPKRGWMCGPQAVALHFLHASLYRNILLEFILQLE